MKKVGVFFGTRPEVIKLAPIILHPINSDFELIPISTGQHSELKDEFVNEFGIVVMVDMELMRPNQTLNHFLSRCIQSCEKVMIENDLKASVVHGDTATALGVALASYNRNIPVFHVEAGLRSNDVQNPFPEEMNRRLISQLASFNFAPTQSARTNLLVENIESSKIEVTGNTIVDALFNFMNQNTLKIKHSEFTESFNMHDKNILLTVHRRENHRNIESFASTLKVLATRLPAVGFWLPVHPNPNVKNVLTALENLLPNLHILPPLGYADFLAALLKSDLVITDSGGVQEESISLNKRCLVLRESTERPEVITSGLGKLVTFESQEFINEVEHSLGLPAVDKEQTSPFGDGKAASRIITTIERILHA
jgi:UDP-N-acetylglucosamine 2-epimerase (non-hydrolysing)